MGPMSIQCRSVNTTYRTYQDKYFVLLRNHNSVHYASPVSLSVCVVILNHLTAYHEKLYEIFAAGVYHGFDDQTFALMNPNTTYAINLWSIKLYIIVHLIYNNDISPQSLRYDVYWYVLSP
jgi:hypothetical protein